MRRIFESIFEPISLFDYSIIRLFEKFVRWPIITRTFEPIFEPIFELILEPIFESILLFDYLIIWKIREMANHYKNLRTDLGTDFRTDFTVRLYDLRNLWDGQSLQESLNRFHCSIIRLFEKFVRWPIIRRIYIILVRCIFNLRMALKKMLIESISTKNMWLTVSIWNSTLFDVYSI